jgi:hypothetical protein
VVLVVLVVVEELLQVDLMQEVLAIPHQYLPHKEILEEFPR